MEANERELPRYLIEDLLFERRLQRNLSSELERLNKLLAEQVRMLEERKTLMADIREAVQLRWKAEEIAESRRDTAMATEEHGHGE